MLQGLSCSRYETCAEAVPDTSGLQCLATVHPGRCPGPDGARRAATGVGQRDRTRPRRQGFCLIVYLIREQGARLGHPADEQKLLGFARPLRNAAIRVEFLRSVVERGLRTDRGLLRIIEGLSAHYSRRFSAKSLCRQARHAHGAVKKRDIYVKQYVDRANSWPSAL